ncbi:TetR/AcrR family transcriptional regulator [Enteractinococcus fodinae]|uniref:AcrR family transcriptional regulator n=1 Tax=Enteractinococcus fodinae TaxID=684663 RepID=A0ABU2B0L8_9MICC|nr:TetR/AcrR family transcriptional regulator [Enteractinococcus fodinae]MDR7347145.1 AcrR family transcriptional regulator [Enteractinococcus fodinae]
MSATPLPDGRNTRWDAHRRQRRNELIKSARAAVHSIGPEVSMEEIAQHAGTSKSVFYRYFEDKQGLQRAVAQASIDFMEAELKRAGSTASTAHDGLYTMVLSYLQLADSSPNVYNFSTAIPTGMAIFRKNMAQFLQRAVEQVAPQYKQHGGDKNLAYYWANAAVGFVRAAGEEWIAEKQQPDRPKAEHLARNIADWLLSGVDSTDATRLQPQEH